MGAPDSATMLQCQDQAALSGTGCYVGGTGKGVPGEDLSEYLLDVPAVQPGGIISSSESRPHGIWLHSGTLSLELWLFLRRHRQILHCSSHLSRFAMREKTMF